MDMTRSTNDIATATHSRDNSRQSTQSYNHLTIFVRDDAVITTDSFVLSLLEDLLDDDDDDELSAIEER